VSAATRCRANGARVRLARGQTGTTPPRAVAVAVPRRGGARVQRAPRDGRRHAPVTRAPRRYHAGARKLCARPGGSLPCGRTAAPTTTQRRPRDDFDFAAPKRRATHEKREPRKPAARAVCRGDARRTGRATLLLRAHSARAHRGLAVERPLRATDRDATQFFPRRTARPRPRFRATLRRTATLAT
jgi:hypothetical protein